MNNKILIFSMILMAILSASAISANDNVTGTFEVEDSIITNESQINEIDDSIIENTNSTNTNEDIAISEISSSDVVGYKSFPTTITGILTSNGTPLSSKNVKIVLNGVTYNKITDSNGKVSLNVKLAEGSYTAQFFHDGDNLTSNAVATSKLMVMDLIKTKLKLGDKDINYRQGSKCLFYVKLVDSNENAIGNQWVTFNVDGKNYTVKTNAYGNAKIYLKLKKGKYKVKYSFKTSFPYLSSSGSYKIDVKNKMPKGNGYWLWSSHMKKVNLKRLSGKGTKHIFLHVHAIYQHGKPSVVSFIKKAHKYGIKVHLWMQVCYNNGKWVRPVNKDGSLKYWFLNKKVKEAKKYAKIKGVDGIHFDYMRFGGTAHLYKTSTKAINYFVKKASVSVHKVKSKCIVSGAIMPEPGMMEYYYGQDVPKISRYLDALLPMVYKGNYGQDTSWITSVTRTFVDQSNGAQVWCGLQSYHSDSNAIKLSHKALLKDAKAAKNGGANGIVLFRFGISCNFNFNKV